MPTGDVVRQAKTRAAERGETLRVSVLRALAAQTQRYIDVNEGMLVSAADMV